VDSLRLWATDPDAIDGPPSEQVGRSSTRAQAGLHSVDDISTCEARSGCATTCSVPARTHATGQRVVVRRAGQGQHATETMTGSDPISEVHVDGNQYKHGSSPGTGISHHPRERIDLDRPDVAWSSRGNWETEIQAQLRNSGNGTAR